MYNIYYTEPTDEIFNEVKEKCIEIWKTYNDEFGYATGNIDKVKSFKNVRDNVMSMIAMFDHINISILYKSLGEDAKKAIKERLIAGGSSEEELQLYYGIK